jgi:hypothetical protein
MQFHEKHTNLTFLSYGINKDDINILQTKKRGQKIVIDLFKDKIY